MIKGKIKGILNDFESELDSLIGDHSIGYGVTYYFDLLYDTFSRSVSFLESSAHSFHNEIRNEEFDVKKSIIHSQENLAYPLLQTLYNSYFITIHSELGSIWDETICIYNKYHEHQLLADKLTSNFFNKIPEDSLEQLSIVHQAVFQHQILFTYNYIRNGIVHSKNDKICEDFQKLENYIKGTTITDIEISYRENGFIFLVKNLDFGKKYCSEILAFIQDVINKSVEQRGQFACSSSNYKIV